MLNVLFSVTVFCYMNGACYNQTYTRCQNSCDYLEVQNSDSEIVLFLSLKLSQQAHNVETTSIQRWFNIKMLNQH